MSSSPETFDCVCGEGFPDLPALQEHWRDRAGTGTGPHYRAGLGGPGWGITEPEPGRVPDE